MAKTRGGGKNGGETRGRVTKGGVRERGGETKGGGETNEGGATKGGGETSEGGVKKTGGETKAVMKKGGGAKKGGGVSKGRGVVKGQGSRGRGNTMVQGPQTVVQGPRMSKRNRAKAIVENEDGVVKVPSSDNESLNGVESTSKEDEPVCEGAATTVEDESTTIEDETTVPAPLPPGDNS